MRKQKGFTLIELMVVIVIIGILSALAIPKMFGVSAKAKAAEAPQVIANWETLNSAYAQETGAGGLPAAIGFQTPMSDWWDYSMFTAVQANPEVSITFGNCAAMDVLLSDFTAGTDTYVHMVTSATMCEDYIPNF